MCQYCGEVRFIDYVVHKLQEHVTLLLTIVVEASVLIDNWLFLLMKTHEVLILNQFNQPTNWHDASVCRPHATYRFRFIHLSDNFIYRTKSYLTLKITCLIYVDHRPAVTGANEYLITYLSYQIFMSSLHIVCLHPLHMTGSRCHHSPKPIWPVVTSGAEDQSTFRSGCSRNKQHGGHRRSTRRCVHIANAGAV
jgi:hypothetical protein